MTNLRIDLWKTRKIFKKVEKCIETSTFLKNTQIFTHFNKFTPKILEKHQKCHLLSCPTPKNHMAAHTLKKNCSFFWHFKILSFRKIAKKWNTWRSWKQNIFKFQPRVGREGTFFWKFLLPSPLYSTLPSFPLSPLFPIFSPLPSLFSLFPSPLSIFSFALPPLFPFSFISHLFPSPLFSPSPNGQLCNASLKLQEDCPGCGTLILEVAAWTAQFAYEQYVDMWT